MDRRYVRREEAFVTLVTKKGLDLLIQHDFTLAGLGLKRECYEEYCIMGLKRQTLVSVN
jgi:hypothetical protein